MKEAIITSKVIFLPLNFNWETDCEQSVNLLVVPEIKLLEFLMELTYLGKEPTAVCINPSRCGLLACDMLLPSCPTSRHDPGRKAGLQAKRGHRTYGSSAAVEDWGIETALGLSSE